MNTLGSYHCSCYWGQRFDGSRCTSINECETGEHSCPTNDSCIDTDWSFECKCDFGYYWNGRRCAKTTRYTFTNSFECSDTPNDATEIQVLNVSIISLPSLCFEEASNCTDIVLRENNLTTIEADAWMGLDNLDSLTIEDNHLQSIPRGAFEHLTNLTFHSLNRNDIQAIEQGAWLHLDTLDYLGLRGNRLSAITANMFTHLQSLTHIELQDNNIRRIEAGAWFGLESLYSLDLSYNELTAVHTQMFRPLQETANGLNSVFSSRETGFNTSALYELHLDNNQISEIEPGV